MYSTEGAANANGQIHSTRMLHKAGQRAFRSSVSQGKEHPLSIANLCLFVGSLSSWPTVEGWTNPRDCHHFG